jgi:hypothetical protein
MSYSFLPWLREGIAADVAQVAGITGLTVVVNQTPLEPLPVHLLGPGDVVGIDPRQVIRTDPIDGARSVEPNYFPFVEFDEPALPWLFSPGVPDRVRLQPWLSLVVVRKQSGVTVDSDPATKMTVLRIVPPAVPGHELPDLAEAWAWAHVQMTGSATGEQLKKVLQTEPQRSLARLICPRRLMKMQSYVACVVPSFAGGRAAGLGEKIDGEPTADAWTLDAERVRLPVYFRWEFETGDLGDFESLAAALEPLSAAGSVGRRDLHLGEPGFEVPGGEAAVTEFGGALRPARDPHGQGGEPASEPGWFVDRMTGMLADADQRSVRPPLYGGVPTGATELPNAGWLRTLNVAPAYRAAAGLGVRFVREQQDSLVEAAWKQAGQLQAVNQFLARAQLASAINKSVTDRIDQLGRRDPLAMLQVLAPTRLPPSIATSHGLTDTVPAAELSAAYRKITRPRGATTRRGVPPGGDDNQRHLSLGAFANNPMEVVQPHNALMARVAAQLAAPAEWGLMERADPTAQIVRPPVFPAPLARELQRLCPDHLLPGAEHLPEDKVMLLEPNRPFIAAFLAGANHEMSRELLWREFPTDLRSTYFRVFWDRWGYTLPTASPEEMVDILPISDWATQGSLGGGVVGAPGVVLVVRGELLRRYPRTVVYAVRAVGSLGTRVLCDETAPVNQSWPLFSGFIDPNITFFGFSLSKGEASGSTGGDGWFFVFQQQPSEPRFGLDVFNDGQFGESPTDSAHLAWGHLVAKEKFDALTHVPVLNGRPAGWTFPDRPGASWTGGSADLAVLTLQRPARVGLHGARLLGG